MKKIMAIVMAIVMMMAIAVPAFAEDKTLDATTNLGDTTVIVNSKDGIGEGTWSVTIPATINLTWGQNGADDYEITSQLATGKCVKVTLEKSKDLTNKTNSADVIPFTATDATDGISDDEVVTNEVHAFDITVDAAEWLDVPYDVYEGQISFTAEVVDA